MNQEVPFIYFNCAEYFNNPELLTSHLFYKKAVLFILIVQNISTIQNY